MSRIAEFNDANDALRFARMKGDDYTVVGGIHLLYAVMPRPVYFDHGDGFSPPEALPASRRDPDLEYAELDS